MSMQISVEVTINAKVTFNYIPTEKGTWDSPPVSENVEILRIEDEYGNEIELDEGTKRAIEEEAIEHVNESYKERKAESDYEAYMEREAG